MLPLPPPALLAVNHLLDGAAWARQRLQPFAGHVAVIRMPPFEAAFSIAGDGRIADAAADAVPEVAIDLPATAPLLALQGHDAVMKEARLSGSADFAQALNLVIQNLRWDAEEDLSTLVGDIAAHRLVQGAREFAGWQRQAAQNLAENVAEYLLHEQPLLASRTASADFRRELDALCAGLAQLEHRVHRL